MRLALLCLLLAACGGSSPLPPAVAATPQALGIQSEWTQYRSSAQPTANVGKGTYCWWPGTGLTASSTVLFPADLRPVRRAVWVVTYVPNGGHVRLVSADDGPSNVAEIVATPATEQRTPINHVADVTAQVNMLIAEAAHHKQIILQVCGDTLVYSSTIGVTW